MDYKQIIHRKFSDQVKVTWNDKSKSADLFFLTEDKTAIVLTMPDTILALLRADIDAALAHRTQPNQHR